MEVMKSKEFNEKLKKYNDLRIEFGKLKSDIDEALINVKEDANNLLSTVVPISYSGLIIIFSSEDKFGEFEEELQKRSLEGYVPRIKFTVRKGSFLPCASTFPSERIQYHELSNIDTITVDFLINYFYQKPNDNTPPTNDTE